MRIFKWFKREEITYKVSLPEEDCSMLFVRAYSSRCGEIAKLQAVWYSEHKKLHIGDFVVIPRYRNRGIGSYVLDEAIGVAKKIGANEVTGNISSIDDAERLCEFYRHRGFVVRECEPQGDNTVATIMMDLDAKIYMDEWRLPLGKKNGEKGALRENDTIGMLH